MLTPQEAEQLFATLRGCARKAARSSTSATSSKRCSALCDTRHHPARRQGDRDLRSQRRDRAIARQHDGRRRSRCSAHRTARRSSAIRGWSFAISTSTPDDPHGVKLDGHHVRACAAGEILGIAGVAGNGQDELFAALSGEVLARPRRRHPDRQQGRRPTRSITERRRLGAAFVPEERLGHATAPRFKLSENVLLTGHAASPMVRSRLHRPRAGARRTCERDHQGLSTCARPSPIRRRLSLSGGNLQKFIVGREIAARAAPCSSSASRPGASMPVPRRDPSGAHRSRGTRRGRAGDQPGSRRALRDRRPASR